jgi:hypothetical protein
LRLKPIIEAKAKEQQGTRTDILPTLVKSEQDLTSPQSEGKSGADERLAPEFGVSPATIKRTERRRMVENGRQVLKVTT